MNDCIYANALTADGNKKDLATRAGRFISLDAVAIDAERIDLDGLTVLPAFVEGHIHLDKSFVGDTWYPHQPVGSLRERLIVEKRLLCNALPITERIEALLAQAHSFGTIAMRSHVDVDPVLGLDNLHAVATACEAWKGRIDVEIVAFPQAGIIASPGTAKLLDAAMREGATVVGGLDPTEFDGDAEAHLDVVFSTAERHDAKIDIHLHEHGAGGIEQIKRIAARTKATGMSGLVTISHAYALGDVSRDEARRVSTILAEAGVSILTNAPGDHPFPPIDVLRAEGVNVFAGNDNIRDAWWPYGNGDLLERAMLIGYRSGFNTDEQLGIALDMITVDAARALGRELPGFAIGDEASFVIVDALNAAAAVASPPSERLLVQHGKIVQPICTSIRSRLL